MTLHTRLLLSYLLLIAVTLGVIVLTLLLALETRPAPPLAVYRQLVGNLQVGLRSLNLEEFNSASQDPADMSEHLLHSLAEATDVRVLLLDVADPPRVRFDSTGAFAPSMSLNLRRDLSIDRVMPTPGRGRADVIAGSFQDPDGSDWLFIGVPAGRRAQERTLVLASPRPRQTLGAALNEFGAALGAPLLQAALVGALAALLLSLAVSRNIANPLQRIAAAARAIAAGRRERRAPVQGPPEIRELANAFNHMSREVQASQQAQQDFLVNVSHDLRTPLTSIQGYSQAIIDGAATDPLAAARVIHEEAGRLNRMVSGISELARLQDRSLPPAQEALQPGPILDGVLQRLALQAQARGVTLERNGAALPVIRGDGDRLARMLTNLLDNAIRHTPAGGTVRVDARCCDDGVEITVADDGPGIPAQDLERIFERFYQVDRARGPDRGSGLGLAIAREIALAHGGSIRAHSDGPGRGSCFTVRLPLAAPASTTHEENGT